MGGDHMVVCVDGDVCYICVLACSRNAVASVMLSPCHFILLYVSFHLHVVCHMCCPATCANVCLRSSAMFDQ